VMTSGNRSDEPIAYRDDDARSRLASIADGFLVHDREIEARCEDSVVRVVRVGGHEQVLMIRRSRGYVPDPIPLPVRVDPPILAVGGHLKNTVCIARDRQAVVGPHGGDLGDAIAFSAYARGVDHLVELSGVAPATIAHDLHPEYLSTKYAADRDDLVSAGVQHHFAHFAACLAEHDERGDAIGLIFDGAGYGPDGSIWGGEILAGDLGGFTRIGHLRPVSLPGGEAAVKKPWRMACAWLCDAHGGDAPLPTALHGIVQPEQWATVCRIARTSSRAPVTTSVGRLLDACAAICGVRPRVNYEGQAAIDFESIARAGATGAYPCAVYDEQTIIIDPREMIRAVERDANAGRDRAEIAAWAHNGLVYAAALAAQAASDRMGTRTIVLSGGVFQNVLMLEALAAALERRNLRVLVPRLLPPNDGGLSYGQAAVAACQRSSDVPGDSWTSC
ncbi:MAG TPA: Sua5/YciO/YrdC/YwlC family protein, partial [Gemmatimonadaceae bacterium]|nr:Sua5/YciO/YrdC/YwlC family protein [Gemmatimonadaceae bacterium]